MSVFVAADTFSRAVASTRHIEEFTGARACSLNVTGRQQGMYHVDRTKVLRGREGGAGGGPGAGQGQGQGKGTGEGSDGLSMEKHIREQRTMLAEWIALSSCDALLVTGSGFARTAAAAGFIRRSWEALHDGALRESGCPATVRPQARPEGAPAGYQLPPYR